MNDYDMEIKIKDANGYIEADWTIEDGVMIVSPKNQEKIDLTQFKAGDVLYCENNTPYKWLCIYRGELEYMGDNIYMEDYCTLYLNGEKELHVMDDYSDSAIFVRHATEEEKQKLFQALADEGLEWDVKERKLVKVKWKPSEGESYYYPYNGIVLYGFEVGCSRWDNDEIDQVLYEKGWAFPDTKQGKADCHKLVDKLNEAINSVKP